MILCSIRKGDAVTLDPDILAGEIWKLRRWFTHESDWRIVSRLPSSVGIVLSVATRERSIPTAARGVTHVSTVKTAEVSWPEGIISECPTQFLKKIKRSDT
ncbi:MAG: hypothetical protein EBZ49_02720 [Proteobacteria bacterium]|nr:hypothetical protein [Pseudomonadota bacterium]